MVFKLWEEWWIYWLIDIVNVFLCLNTRYYTDEKMHQPSTLGMVFKKKLNTIGWC